MISYHSVLFFLFIFFHLHSFRGRPANCRVCVEGFRFCRVHSTLRVTPAMEAGIAGHVWTIGELLAPVYA